MAIAKNSRTDLLPHASEASEQPGVVAPVRRVNRLLVLSLISLALISIDRATSFPLTYVALPILVYVFYVMSTKYVRTAVKNKNVPLALLDILGNGGPLVTGNFFASAFLSSSYYAAQKLMLWTEDHSRKDLVSIFGEQPQFVTVLRDGEEVQVPFDSVLAGENIVVHAGSMIPVDGHIIEGVGRIDERSLTGEFQPAEKGPGDQTFAGTVALSGRLTIEIERAGKDSVAAQIAEALNATADYKSGLQTRGEMIMNRGAIPTLALSALALVVVGVQGALAIFFAAFGYHMRFAAPISVLIYLRLASRNGIMVKDGRSLEQLSSVDTVVFDKTGTLTEDQPVVADINVFGDMNQDGVIALAAAAEMRQSHPIALAIVAEAKDRCLSVPESEDTAYEVGAGLIVKIDGQDTLVGSRRLMSMNGIDLSQQALDLDQACSDRGTSLVYVATAGTLVGAIELRPAIRAEVRALSDYLGSLGIRRVIISGDREAPTRQLANSLDFEGYHAETLPEDKAGLISKLQKEGRSVCYIGDGINDSIALKQANVSVSLNGASAVATDVAGAILMDGTLRKVSKLLDLSRSLDRNLKTTTVLSFTPGVICVAGVFFYNISLVTAILIYNAGLAVSTGSAILPWFSNHWSRRRAQRTAQTVRAD